MKKRRSRTIATDEGLVLVIPSYKQIGASIFICFWLCGWAVGEFFASFILFREATSNEDSLPWPAMLFLVIWLAFWTYGGFAAVCHLAWMLFGQERICLFADGLRVQKRTLKFNREKRYDYAEIRDLRLAPEGLDGGKILFDYGAETIDICKEVHYAEAKQILVELNELFDLDRGLTV